ncbi:MAG: methyltransferase domain-containing protein [Nitrospira sp.]|nr:methyltransferase domain-containing protein [Nitrospira sp.]
MGPADRVIGIDHNGKSTMLEIARRHAPSLPQISATHSEHYFTGGMADTMPVEDASVDLIISNCVINLAPDKRKGVPRDAVS